MIVDLERTWASRARCSGEPLDTFFIDHGFASYDNPTPKVQAAWNKAKMICADCPVIKECARDCLGEIDGVWGGLDPAQRMEFRRTHGERLRLLQGELKEEYAQLAFDLQKRYSWPDVARLIGVSVATAKYLVDWHKTHLRQQAEASAPKAGEVKPQATSDSVTPWPLNPPREGDGWVRRDATVIRGLYLGETEDGSALLMKVPIYGRKWTTAWFDADAVKLTRDVAKVIRVRVGAHGKRPKSDNREPAATG